MNVEQIHLIVNETTSEILGKEDVLQKDLSNIVDVGKEILSASSVDNYVKKLVNRIGKTVFDDRVYSGNAPSVIMDSWEYGSILQKISADIPEAQENDSWNLEHGKSYDDDIFYQPKVSAKFFNSKVTFEVPISFTERQVKESFTNAQELSGFLSMIFNAVDKSLTIKIDSLVMQTINNMTAETMIDDLSVDGVIDYSSSGVKAINLLKLYNDHTGETLTVDNAYTNPEFIRYSSYMINLYRDRMTKISTLFNVGGKDRFTPPTDISIVLLSDFASSINVFLNSDVYNEEMTSLPSYDTVPYWQGSGTDYGFDSVSKISIKTTSGTDVESTGILGVMFDRQALGVSNLDKRVTSNFNAKAEFYTNYYKLDAGYYNDLNENFIVFFIG